MDLLGGGPPPDWLIVGDDGTVAFIADLEVDGRSSVAMSIPTGQLRTSVTWFLQSLSSFGAPSTAPDLRHATTYIICEHDQAVPLAAQEQWAAAADNVVRLPSSHQAMVSMPERLAAVLAQIGSSQHLQAWWQT